MNRILLSMFVSMMFLFITSCEEDGKNISEMKPVSNITYEAKPGEVLFKWDNPKSEQLSYVEITFKKTNDQQDVERILVPAPKSEQSVYGLPDAAEREYTFTTYYGEQKSEPVKVKASPQETPFNSISQSLKVKLTMEGVNVSWNNTDEGEYYIELNYLVKKVQQEYEIVIKEKGEGSRDIPISGIFATDLNFRVTDEYGNQSAVNTIVYQKLENGKFDRQIWEVVDYSSEESVGEDGRAVNMLDGNNNTFWHSKWKDASDDLKKFPHYVTFDLTRKVIITEIQIRQRHNKVMAKDVIIYGSNESFTSGWQEIISLTLPNSAGGEIRQTLETPVEYRYVKLFLKTPGSGDTAFGAIGEFVLYGKDIVE